MGHISQVLSKYLACTVPTKTCDGPEDWINCPNNTHTYMLISYSLATNGIVSLMMTLQPRHSNCPYREVWPIIACEHCNVIGQFELGIVQFSKQSLLHVFYFEFLSVFAFILKQISYESINSS